MTATAPGPAPAPAVVALGRRADAGAGADGDPGGPASRRRVVLWVVALLLLVVAAAALIAARPPSSDVPLASDNAEPAGARAAAQILREQGVRVTPVSTTAAAIAEAEAGTTLLVVRPGSLSDEQRTALADVPADVVLVELDGGDLDPLTDRVEPVGFTTRSVRDAGCSDPDAVAAQQVLLGGVAVTGDVDALCFAGGPDGTDGAGYAVWTDEGRTWRVLTDAFPLSNAGLASDGNAALVLRALGQHERLTWYVPDPDDDFADQLEAPRPLIPVEVVVMMLLVGLAAVIWQARRLGPVVVEPLPVVVRASETTRGRGRLYRRAHAHGHAGAALRAGLVARLAGRVGLPAHAGPDEVVDRLSRASGRPAEAISDLLYGTLPTDDDSLEALTRALDTLESEVVRR